MKETSKIGTVIFQREFIKTIDSEEQDKIINIVNNKQLVSVVKSYNVFPKEFDGRVLSFDVSINAGYFDDEVEISPYKYSLIISIEHRLIFKHFIRDINIKDTIHEH